MKNLLFFLLFACVPAHAMIPPDAGVERDGASLEEIDKSMAAVSRIEEIILHEFAKTKLQTRIVKVRVKRGRKTKVYLTWHPRKPKDIAKDTFLIVKIITKAIPRFYSISLIAIDPSYMRWSGHVFWNGVVIRSAVQINRFGEPRPQPLYRLPTASPH